MCCLPHSLATKRCQGAQLPRGAAPCCRGAQRSVHHANHQHRPRSRTRQEQDAAECQCGKQATQCLSTQPAADLAAMPRLTCPERELLPSREGLSAGSPPAPPGEMGLAGSGELSLRYHRTPPSLCPCRGGSPRRATGEGTHTLWSQQQPAHVASLGSTHSISHVPGKLPP